MATERKQRGPLDPELPSTKTDFSEKYDVSSLKNKTALITGGATGIGQVCGSIFVKTVFIKHFVCANSLLN
jgi:hypothetical protein